MIDLPFRERERILNIIKQGAESAVTDLEFLEMEIQKWKTSKTRRDQLKGELYDAGFHDILTRKRKMIGKGGKLEEVANLPNNRLIDNRYAVLVEQKTNYLLGQPIVIKTENRAYSKLLEEIFNKRFMRTMKNAARMHYNQGISYLFPYYNEEGEFAFKVFPGYEIRPFWRDAEHTRLDGFIRLYEVDAYEGKQYKVIEKVEYVDLQGIHRYILDGTKLIPDVVAGEYSCHMYLIDDEGNELGYNWSRVPLIPLKYNEKEIPLLKKVKTLQDALNVMLSDFMNNMQEDARNTILVLKNYDGTDLGQFRHNLATYGAIKVRYDDGAKGGVETLSIQVNADNYKTIIEILKKTMIENGMGYDAKDDRLSGNANQMNIQSMYNDIDMDANNTETEHQAAIQDMLWFVNMHLHNTGQGSFEGEKVEAIYNRDMMMNEAEIVGYLKDLIGWLPDETILEQLPFIDDPKTELKRMKEQKRQQMEDSYSDAFGHDHGTGDTDDETE